METNKKTFLPFNGHYRNLRVYHITEALYDLTHTFCQRFLPPYGDRTVDQMVQAARSGKQNIAEGNQAGATSSETEIKLTNVAKASLEELLVDYEDYLRTHNLPQWGIDHPRMEGMRRWTRSEDFLQTYAERAPHMTDEEFANLCITLCHQSIYMLGRLIDTLQDRFVKQGGIKERMHAARTGYRKAEDEELKRLRSEAKQMKSEIERLQNEAKHRKSEIERLQSEAEQMKSEIERLRKENEELKSPLKTSESF